MTTECVHYWVLGPAAPIVPGTCKHCGQTKNFSGDMWDANSEGGPMRHIIHDTAVRNTERKAHRAMVENESSE